MVDPPQLIAPGVSVRGLELGPRDLLVEAMITGRAAGPRMVRCRTLWALMENLSGQRRCELEKDRAFLREAACQKSLADALLAAYGLLVLHDLFALGAIGHEG